jgi:hypothetical protein
VTFKTKIFTVCLKTRPALSYIPYPELQKMRIAHLVLAHKNPKQLERLLKAMEHPAFDFFIHIDKKTDARAFAHLFNEQTIFPVQERTKIYWAGYGTIQATINGFRQILPKDYNYINVISAQDFPIKSPDYIYQYIKERQRQEFMTCESVEDEWREAAMRVHQYHLINWRIPGRYRLERVINKILPKRKYPLPHKIVGRANWFTVTKDAALYLLNFIDSHPEIVRFFKYSWGADELIFSTVLYNSGFKERLTDNLVYVDWSGSKTGHPKILTVDDIERLKVSDKLFARKFDLDFDDSIISLLEEWIKRTN